MSYVQAITYYEHGKMGSGFYRQIKISFRVKKSLVIRTTDDQSPT